MDKINVFKTYLNKFVKLTDVEFDQTLLPIIKIREFEKKEKLTKVGEVENYLNFIVKGLIRKFYKKGSQEIITQISSEGHIIHCQESFHSRQPSEYTIETIEPSIVISIKYDELENAFASSKKMEHLARLIITHTMQRVSATKCVLQNSISALLPTPVYVLMWPMPNTMRCTAIV